MLAPTRCRFPCNAGARAVPSPMQHRHPCNAVTSATLAPVRHWCPCSAIPHATPVPTHARCPSAPEGATHCLSPPAIGGRPLCRGPRSPRGPGSSSSSPRRPPAGQREGGSAGTGTPSTSLGLCRGWEPAGAQQQSRGSGPGLPTWPGPSMAPGSAPAAAWLRPGNQPGGTITWCSAASGRVWGKGRENMLGEAGAALGAPRDVGFVPWDGAEARCRGCSRSPPPCDPLPTGQEVPGPGVPGEVVPCPAAIRDGNRRQAMAEPRQLPTRDVASRPGPPVPTHASRSCRDLRLGVRSPMDPRTWAGSHTTLHM